MKKGIAVLLACLMTVGILAAAGCSPKKSAAGPDGDFYVQVDADGYELRAWQSDFEGSIVFLPDGVSPSDLTLSCYGIEIESTDSGTVDQETNTVSGAFTKSGDRVSITSKNGNVYPVTVMQSALPSVTINLKDTTLERINEGEKEAKYKQNTVRIRDTDGAVLLDEDVTVRGRGNSTWKSATKKSYQLKLSEEAGVLGMEPSDKWILQANAFDETMLRNEIAFQASRELQMPYTPEFRFVNVWVDGEYIGVYTIGESVDIAPGRAELSDPEGILAEMDSAYYMEEEYWFTTSQDSFGVKATVSDEEEEIRRGIENFKTRYEGLWTLLSETPPEEVTLSMLSEYIDVESFAKMFLILEFYLNKDAYLSSTYFYQDGAEDVIHFGPAWDFDCSMGNVTGVDTLASAEGSKYKNGILISTLLETDAFSEYVTDYYETHREIFESSAAYSEELFRELEAAADMNYARWEYAYRKNDSSYYDTKWDIAPFHADYAEGCAYLKDWLEARAAWFDQKW